jgi:hypothetical protein
MAPRSAGLASSPLARAMLVLAAVAVAYRYSLDTLVATLGTDTPLAYLGLAPLIAFGVAMLLARPQLGRPEVGDRHLDYMVGLPLLATALLMTVVLPARMSILFWYYRVDLLSLPLFVAGAVALLFGSSTLYRIRYAIGFLLLARPPTTGPSTTGWAASPTSPSARCTSWSPTSTSPPCSPDPTGRCS